MEFNLEEFRKTKFENRTKELTLRNFGDGAESVTWTIRGLNAEDLAEIEDAVQKSKMLLEMTDLLAKAVSDSGSAKDKKSAIKEIMGIDEKVPALLVKQYVVFEKGSLIPKFTERALTVKFARVYPAEFTRIVNEIYALTNLGGMAKKKPAISGSEPT